jgi:hypothetical protein
MWMDTDARGRLRGQKFLKFDIFGFFFAKWRLNGGEGQRGSPL